MGSGYNGRTPLMLAAECGHHQICKYLVTEQNANLEVKNYEESTALMCAAIASGPEVIKVLLKNKANSKAIDSIGCHAAYLAANYRNLDALKILVEKDGD